MPAFPHLMASMPNLALHPSTKKESINPTEIVKQWLSSLETHLQNGTILSASNLFLPSNLSYWRDILALSWDWSTKNSASGILSNLAASRQGLSDLQAVKEGALQPALVELEGVVWVQSGFTFKNKFGYGRGFVRFVNGEDGEWKAWTVYTQLGGLTEKQEVNGHSSRAENEVQVLVVGAGQSGLAIGAQLQHLGLKYLLVDKHQRAGDSWRVRYDSIKPHTPTYSDHYPFLPYPADFPEWMDRDRIADWQEHYGKTLNLNIEMGTSANVLEYDEESRKYTVVLTAASNSRTVQCNHLILAAGMFSTTPILPSFPNQSTFKGEIYHSVAHKSASHIPDIQNKKVVCIGAGTSSHDIAEDFVHASAKNVSILQRHPIITVTRDAYVQIGGMNLWNTPGVKTEEADIMATSFPYPILRTMNIHVTAKMNEFDKSLLEPMHERGYQTLKGVGMVDQQFLKGGHFYIDQGACGMIADGRIQMINDEKGIEKFMEKGFVLGDGREVEADVVVLGTGFQRIGQVVEEIMGSEVRSKVGDIGRLDEEAERIGWWRPTGVPGLWYMTGSFIWCRTFSAALALQIAAVERGLNPGYYEKDTRSRVAVDKPELA